MLKSYTVRKMTVANCVNEPAIISIDKRKEGGVPGWIAEKMTCGALDLAPVGSVRFFVEEGSIFVVEAPHR